jgi:hypothetical protein
MGVKYQLNLPAKTIRQQNLKCYKNLFRNMKTICFAQFNNVSNGGVILNGSQS